MNTMRLSFPCVAMSLALVLPGSALAQKARSQGVVIDYLTGATYYEARDGSLLPAGIHPSIRAGSPLQIKVLNVNTLKYAVSVDSEQTSAFTARPAALQSFFAGHMVVPHGDGKDLDSAFQKFDAKREGEKLAVDARGWSAAAHDLSRAVEDTTTIISAEEKLADLLPRLEQMVMSAPDPRLEDEKPGDPRAASRLIAESLKKQVMGAASDLLKEIESTPGLDAELLPKQGTPDFVLASRTLRRELIARNTKLNDIYEEFTRQSQGLSLAMVSSPEGGAKSLLPELEHTRSTAGSAVAGIQRYLVESSNQQPEILGSLKQLSALYQRVVNEDFFVKEGRPFTPREDNVRINITVLPLAPLAWLQAQNQDPKDGPRPVTVDVDVVGRTKIDYSSGLYFTGLTDDKYNLVNSNGQNIVTKGASDQFKPGFGALMHIYQTSTARFIPALSLGLSFDGTDPCFLLGGTLLSGRENRLALTLGIAGRQVQRLNGVQVGQPTDLNVNELTTKVFRTGFFVGVSFNVGS